MGLLDKLDKIKSSLNVGGGRDEYADESLYDDDDRISRRSDDFDDYDDEPRGYSRSGYGRPGRGGLSDDDGYDYDDPGRTRYDTYGRSGSQSDRYDAEPADDAQGGIQYRSSSSADSVHVVSRGSEPSSRGGYSSARSSRFSRSSKKEPTGELRIVRASRYEDIEVVSRYFKAGDTVALVLSNVKPDVGRRILDFSYGVVSGLGGKVDRAGATVFALTHNTAGLSDDERTALRAQGLVE